nr:EOG090X0ARU [Cyclestheria hislopi]
MFKRKLSALGYLNVNSFNIADDSQFRNVILWLEDQKIRRYKIEQREGLRNSNTEQWAKALEQYLLDVDCPIPICSKNEVLDWLLSLSVHLEFSEKADQIKSNAKGSPRSATTDSSLDSLDVNSVEFKQGVNTLAGILNIPRHHDHLITLEAITNFVKERLNAEALADPSKLIIKGDPFPLEKGELSFEEKDTQVNYAAKALRLLFINDLRDLQTKINECKLKAMEFAMQQFNA